MSILSIAIFGIYDLLIKACLNCPIDFKPSLIIPDTVRQNVNIDRSNSIIVTKELVRSF